ncbi:MAG: hypothetical protein JWP97_1570 [Labilithrix sp.]|nr:hypothetical protein [Labilithrix sp.]
MSNATFKHVTGDRVHVLLTSRSSGGPGAEWLPGEVMDAHVLFGRPRYVVLLDDDRRLVASAFQIRTRPPIAWVDAAMAELSEHALDIAS